MPRKFSISTPSRHPANQNGYDGLLHRYKADYVNPKFWILNLDASPGLPKSSDGKVQVPGDILSFSWRVKQLDGPFSVVDHRTSSPIWQSQVQIPEPGEYEVTLEVTFTGGRREINTRRYRLRDFLVVSIGDSFASGQGNPDLPAIPSPDEEVICNVVTFDKLISSLKGLASDLLKKLDKGLEKGIEETLPFIGKGVVAVLNDVEDVGGFIKDSVKDSIAVGVDLVEDVGSAIVGGIEEIGGLIGIGGDGPRHRHARWQEPHAYRSYRSGHSLAARLIETDNESGADRVTFLSFARSGASIPDGLLGPMTVDGHSINGWVGDRGEIKEAKDTILNRRIDALLIAIGVNDLGITDTVTDLVRNDVFFLGGDDAAERKKIADKVDKKLNQETPGRFESLKSAIDSQLRPRQVFITEYPAGLFTKLDENHQVKDGGPCGAFSGPDLDLDVEDGRTLRRLARGLNALIRVKADKFGWHYVGGIEHAFNGHGYCASQPYFVSAEESCLNQGDFEGMIHPNKKGHEITRDRIAQALKKQVLMPQENWLEPVLNVMMS